MPQHVVLRDNESLVVAEIRSLVKNLCSNQDSGMQEGAPEDNGGMDLLRIRWIFPDFPVPILIEELRLGSADSNFPVLLHKEKLLLKSARLCNVIRIHSGYVSSFRLGQAKVELFAESQVLIRPKMLNSRILQRGKRVKCVVR